MNLNLSNAELVVLAAHLDLEPTFAVGERAPEELQRLRDEGWRSLLIRDLIRIEDDSTIISSELVSIASDILAPLALITHTRATGSDGQISHVIIGQSQMLNATPLVEDVAAYASISIEQVVNAILVDTEAVDDAATIHRVEVVDGRERQSERELAWVRCVDGQILMESESGSQEMTDEEVQTMLTQLLAEAADGIQTTATDR